MIRILIVEDEKAISELIRMNLKRAGYDCDTAYDGNEASVKLEQERYDLILLDVMLPYVNGFELMEYIRTLGTPAIFITAKAGLDDRVRGLTSGADDYIVKPFEVVELLARINIVLRRYHKVESVLAYGDIQIDVENHVVKRGDETVDLTPREYELLVMLVRNVGITLFRERLYEEVWGPEHDWDSRTLDLHIQRIRKKLDLKEQLKTVFKTGYRLEKRTEGER